MATRRNSKNTAEAKLHSAITKMTEEVLQCRDIGHTWHLGRVRRVQTGYERLIYCQTCKTNKHQFLSVRGEILASNYSYKPGYQIHGIGRLLSDGRAAIRLENLVRTVSETSVSEV